MAPYANQFDFILDTVAAPHNLDDYLQLLKRDGTLCLVGAPQEPHPHRKSSNLIFKRRQLAGSLIGGIREAGDARFLRRTRYRLGCGLIPIQQINEAYERMLRSDVKYRFVIDMASLGAEPT